ncbi:unnamed protein product [Chrysodeixis includens]|uniref:Uncharacterized protein n=1 Tax=Chrysodeixis includens TaxID=689277 RepID=A0A9N8Q106_CHRIL|nr:unnamed protein product [Chrysodeixis includens]
MEKPTVPTRTGSRRHRHPHPVPRHTPLQNSLTIYYKSNRIIKTLLKFCTEKCNVTIKMICMRTATLWFRSQLHECCPRVVHVKENVMHPTTEPTTHSAIDSGGRFVRRKVLRFIDIILIINVTTSKPV